MPPRIELSTSHSQPYTTPEYNRELRNHCRVRVSQAVTADARERYTNGLANLTWQKTWQKRVAVFARWFARFSGKLPGKWIDGQAAFASSLPDSLATRLSKQPRESIVHCHCGMFVVVYLPFGTSVHIYHTAEVSVERMYYIIVQSVPFHLAIWELVIIRESSIYDTPRAGTDVHKAFYYALYARA
jgi:hypothetical protein